MADDAPWIDPVVVPDDIRALQAEVDAYHRELRDAGRRRLVRRLAASPAWRHGAKPLAVFGAALALAGVVFTVLTLGDPGVGRRALPTPVATAPLAPIGEVDGLLPDLTLRTVTGQPRSLREMRPALLALLPPQCACARLVESLAGQAETVGASLIAIAPAAVDADVAALPGRIHSGRVSAYFDPVHALADIYSAIGVTLLVVSPDATVSHILRNVQPGVHLEAQLFDGITAPRRAHSQAAH